VFETGLATRATSDGLFKVQLHAESDLKRLSEFVLGLKSGKSRQHSNASRALHSRGEESRLLAQIKESLSWRYQFSETSSLPAKSSVTQLTHAHDEFVKFDYSRALERLPNAIVTTEPDSGAPVEPRLIGTAVHLVISELDLTKPVTSETIEETKERLTSENAIAPGVAVHINTNSILDFFQTEQGRLALDPANLVWREWPFTFSLPASEWEGLSPPDVKHQMRESIVVQGIIDLLIRTPQGLVIVDFKTDRVTAERVAERAELYRGQLTLYGRASSAILRVDTVARWLYFLGPRRAVEV
jgi:ATP-dependent helicase/nuclease subunit A